MRVAIIIDWGNIKRRVFDKKGFPKEFSYKGYKDSDLTNFLCFFNSFLDKDEKLFRIFFYTAKPYEKDLSKHFKDLKETLSNEEKEKILENSKKIANVINKFLHDLGKQNYIALRLGTLSFEGWDSTKEPPKPKFKQKKVDMLIGLDIAHLAYKKLVQRILLFCYDTDIQPALKVARMEGLQIVLPKLEEEFVENPPYDLLKHADIVRPKTLDDIKKDCGLIMRNIKRGNRWFSTESLIRRTLSKRN